MSDWHKVKILAYVAIGLALAGCGKVYAQNSEQFMPGPKAVLPDCTEGSWHIDRGVLTLECYQYPTSAKITVSDPFDRKLEEWDSDDDTGMVEWTPCVPPAPANATYVCTKPLMQKKHHSGCAIPGTHTPDPKRFPIQDATGVTHCLALLKDK